MSNALELQQHVIALINEGALLLSLGRMTEAISTLGAALKFSKPLLRQTQKDQEPSVVTELKFDSWMLPTGHGGLFEDISRDGFVYTHAIVIPEDAPNNFASNTLVSSAMIFNLALAHHIYAIRKGNNPRLLQQAVSFYQHSLTMCRGSPISKESCTMYTMAALNNMGVCLRGLSKDDLAEKCFQSLLTIFFFVQSSPGSRNVSSASSNFHHFFENVSHLLLPASLTIISTAAAA
jgi:tetratricopeptide (TPR) repeat protein